MAIAAELGIVSIGVTLLMIGGHFDLSVGAVLGLTSYVAVVLMRDFGLSPLVAAPAAVAGRRAASASSTALIVVRFRIHSFVVTLGTMLIWRGVLIALTGGFPMTVDIPPAFKAAMAGPLLGGFRMSMLWFIVHRRCSATFLLSRTRFGNWMQACGQNPQAARNLGVPVDRVTVILFMITSALAAVAGRHPGRPLRLGRRAARRRDGAAGRGGDRDRRHAALRRLWQRHRHHPRRDHLRDDPGRPGARRRAGAFLQDADRR